MFGNIAHNILAFDVNSIGLILGFMGSLILTFFGLPPLSLLNEGAYIELTVTKKMIRHMRISRFAIFLMVIGFLMQLLAIPAIH